MDDVQSPKEIIKTINEKLQTQKIVIGIEKGEIAPDFLLPNQDGKIISLSEFRPKNVILSFYRGDWCGYCRRELQDLNNHVHDFAKLNAIVLAVAPQTVDKARKLKEEHKYQFPLLCDETFEVIKSYKIDFEVHSKIQEIYTNILNINIPKLNVNDDWQLPVPATFIIDSEGIVIESFVQMDYTSRLSAVKIIEILRKNF